AGSAALIGIPCIECRDAQLSPAFAPSSGHRLFTPKSALQVIDIFRTLLLGQPGKTRERHDCLAAQARLKVVNEASGRLGRVRPAVGVEGTESKVRVLVQEPSVLSPQRQVA